PARPHHDRGKRHGNQGTPRHRQSSCVGIAPKISVGSTTCMNGGADNSANDAIAASRVARDKTGGMIAAGGRGAAWGKGAAGLRAAGPPGRRPSGDDLE